MRIALNTWAFSAYCNIQIVIAIKFLFCTLDFGWFSFQYLNIEWHLAIILSILLCDIIILLDI